ncbi:P-loop containing nucleoside triphosphate hydrolase protein [Morchella snyderi]|nr:P-loop containing nucleoside triphosphate hydrolase protein [Morchella snyderi]
MLETISITVCGDGGTGKSSISLRLVRSKWTHEYDPTVQDSYSVTRAVDGREYQLSLTDTAGQEEYRGLWAQQNLAADAYLLVYDITNHDSLLQLDYFNDIIEMESEERMLQPGAVPHVKIVAGNKCDLANSRQVSSQEGLAWARSHDCGFMETSARNVVNVEETFALLVRRVVAAREAARNGTAAVNSGRGQQQQSVAANGENPNNNTGKERGANTPKPGETGSASGASKKMFGCCAIC